MAYNPNSYFNYEAGRGSIYSSPPKSKPKNANQQAAKSMGSAGIGGLGGKPTTTAAQKIQDNFREQTQKDSGSTYDEIALPTEAEVDKGIKKGLGSPDKSDDDNKDQTPLSRIKSTFDSVSEMMGLGKPEKPKRAAYTPEKIYSTAAFRARSNDPIDLDAQNRRINAAVDFGNRAPMAYLPVGGTYDEITKQRGADERSQQKMAESINATIEQLYAANDPARQFYQSGVPMEQRLFAPELGYDEIALPSEATVDKKVKGLGARPDVTVTELDYTVESGDTLSEIAQKNNTTVEELVRINNIEDKDIIDVGQKIKLQDYVPEVTVTELDDDYVAAEDTTRTPDEVSALDNQSAAEAAMGRSGTGGIMTKPEKDTRYFEAGRGDTTETGGGKAKTIQKKLNDLGYNAGAVDGDIGKGTERAIRKFQAQHGVAPTGNLDSATYNILISDDAEDFPDPRQSIPASEIESITSDKGDFEVMKKALAKIESGPHGYSVYKYNTGKHKAGDLLYGGANDHYLGKYQMGKDALSDVGVGYTKAKREAFLKDPVAQDKAFKKFVENNHRKLTRESQRYRDMTKEEKLGVLGYAHNQGATAAIEWLFTGVSGADANGTKGTKYTTKIAEAFADPNAASVRDFYEVTP